MTENSSYSIMARLKSFAHAIRGIRFLVRSQINARIHLAATIVVVILSSALSISRVEWCMMTLAITLVWIAEGLNTAIECLTDLVSPDHHPLAGRTKDVAAGAVLVAAIGACVVGGLIFIPHLRLSQ